MENQNEQLDSTIEQTDEQQLETTETQEVDVNELAERLAKIEEVNKQLFERAKRAESKLVKEKVDRKVETVLEEKKADLDETQLEYLDLKGVRDDEEIELIKGVMKRTGMSLRGALNDDYTQTKLSVLRKDRERLDATPGATRRTGGTAVNTVDYWVARHEQSGGKELPKDFALRAEVINRLVDRDSGNKPAWRS